MEVDRWSLLALLRFLLASVVAMNHLDEQFLLGRLGAFEAVLGFLVISGWSVSTSHAQRPAGFLGRRLRRVYPMYAVCLLFTLLVKVLVEQQPLPGVGEFIANALLLNQLVTTTSILGPAWSLSLEFWFYALLPLLAALPARRVRLLAWISFAAFAAYTVARTLLHLPYYSGVGYGANVLLLAFAWVTGSRMARPGVDALSALRDLRWMFGAHLLLDALIQLGHRLKHHEGARFAVDDLPGFCLHGLTLMIVLVCFAQVLRPSPRARAQSRWMNALGDWSYPLYLVHVPLYAIFAMALGPRSLATFGVAPMSAFATALAVAAALHRIVERPSPAATVTPPLARPA